MDKLLQFQGTIYENGYGLIAKKVIKNPSINLKAKAVYAYLCAYAGSDSSAFPPISLILEELDITKKTFYKHLNELIAFGLITKKKNRSNNGKFENNIYTIECLPTMVENLPHGKKSTEEILPCGKNVPTTININNNNNKELNPMEVYQNNIFPTPGKIDIDIINDWTNKLGADIVIYALELATKANVRRLQYIEKILMDWERNGVKTVSQAKAYTSSRKNTKASSKYTKKNETEPVQNAGAYKII